LGYVKPKKPKRGKTKNTKKGKYWSFVLNKDGMKKYVHIKDKK